MVAWLTMDYWIGQYSSTVNTAGLLRPPPHRWVGEGRLGGMAGRAVMVVITDGIVVGWLGLRLGAG